MYVNNLNLAILTFFDFNNLNVLNQLIDEQNHCIRLSSKFADVYRFFASGIRAYNNPNKRRATLAKQYFELMHYKYVPINLSLN
jgi:hypothetical protein